MFQSLRLYIYLVTGSRKNFIDLDQLSRRSLHRLLLEGRARLLLLEVDFRLGASLILQLAHQFPVLPSDVGGQVAHAGVFPSGLEAHHAQRRGHHLALHLVVRMGHALEGAQSSNGRLTAGRLLMDHAANGAPNDPGRALEMVGSAGRVGVHSLLTKVLILGLVAHEGSGDDHLLAPDEDDFLSGEEFLGHDGTEAAVEVVAAVDDDGLFENHDFIL